MLTGLDHGPVCPLRLIQRVKIVAIFPFWPASNEIANGCRVTVLFSAAVDGSILVAVSTATNTCSPVTPGGIARLSGVLVSAKRAVMFPGVAPISVISGDVEGAGIGLREPFGRLSPSADLSSLLTPLFKRI